jgi:parvulin-like peptidyl-prolyl isomerase
VNPRVVMLVFACGLSAVAAAIAQDASSDGWGSLPPPETIVARVVGRDVTAGEVRRILATATAGLPPAPQALVFLESQAVEQLVNRLLVREALDAEKFPAVAEADLDVEMKRLEDQAAAQGTTLDKLPGGRELSKERLREQVAWEMRWANYARQQITDDQLEKFFLAHRKDFDGSEVRVSHILFRAGAVRDLATIEGLVLEARQLRDEILAEKVSFADAAKRFSAGPSRNQGGDLGFIPRHERMVESFSQAAFALAKGEISQPVTSPFGVHLILCTDWRPGTRTWDEVRPQLQAAAANELFVQLSDQQRPTTAIEFTGAMPYVDPRTRQIVMPGAKPAKP